MAGVGNASPCVRSARWQALVQLAKPSAQSGGRSAVREHLNCICATFRGLPWIVSVRDWGCGDMSFVSLSRVATCVAVFLSAALLLATQLLAQSSGTVDCGNGSYCPAGNACLVGGLCARMVDAVPGAVRTS